ncbi:MAG TPA: CHC2 zinc finger domain-containing protein [Thermoanaerobaculia bacterium]|nr:CHC2 zinc finger domain-containing protein [Thermoanaerobaculia bacterium]
MNYHDQALRFHQFLPTRLWHYLTVTRGIGEAIVHRELLGWNGRRITIPVKNESGEITAFRLARDPDEREESPKMLSTRGSSTTLYGVETLRWKPKRIVICEGEFDRLVLLTHGFGAVSSTGGAFSFRSEWARYFESVPEVYLCFDRDRAGEEGVRRAARFIPHARVVTLPPEVGERGDVSDFFVRLGRSAEDFEKLLGEADTPPQAEAGRRLPRIPSRPGGEPIEEVIGRSVALRRAGRGYSGLCPFHRDSNPSFVVFPRSQRFRCFACGVEGGAADFLARLKGVSPEEAHSRLNP